jgi:hypothetical protein
MIPVLEPCLGSAIDRRSVVIETRIWLQESPCVICGTHSGTVPPDTSLFLSRNYFTNAPHLFFKLSPILYNLNQCTVWLYNRTVGSLNITGTACCSWKTAMTIYVIITNTSICKTDRHQLGPIYKFHKICCCSTNLLWRFFSAASSSVLCCLHIAFILAVCFDKTYVPRLHAPNYTHVRS